MIFWDNYKFLSKDTFVPIKPDLIFTRVLIPQLTPEEWILELDTVYQAIFGCSVMTMIFSWSNYAILNMLLSSLRSLLILIHLFIINVQIPARVVYYLRFIFSIATFDFFPVIELYKNWGIDLEGQPLSLPFELVGY